MSPAAPVPARTRLPPAVAALLVVLGFLGLGAAVIAVAAQCVGPPEVRPPVVRPAVGAAAGPGAAVGAVGATLRAREVLREWDRRREAAWRAGDPEALAALYLPGSVAGQRDVVLLRRWRARGARVTRLQPQVLALQVVDEGTRRLVVRVTDRLGIVAARVAGESLSVPRGRPTIRRIDLRRGPRTTSAWRVASVRDLGVAATLAG